MLSMVAGASNCNLTLGDSGRWRCPAVQPLTVSDDSEGNPSCAIGEAARYLKSVVGILRFDTRRNVLPVAAGQRPLRMSRSGA